METRKAQQLGPSTLAVTLPAEWTKENGVEKGDEMVIFTSTGRLWIENDPGLQVGTGATIHAENLDADGVERAVIAQYALGQRVIRVTHADGTLDNAHINAVHSAETQLMGLGIIEETSECISIRCSVDPEDFVLDDLLSRLGSTGSTMRNEAIKALAHGNPDIARPAIDREQQANRIFVLLLRLIFTVHQDPTVAEEVGIEDNFPLIGYRSIAKNLELIADAAQDIATLAVEAEDHDLDATTIREIREFNDQVEAITEKGLTAAIDRDYDLAMEVHERFAEMTAQDPPTFPNEPGLRDVSLKLRHIAELGTRNAEIAANLSLTGDSEYVTQE